MAYLALLAAITQVRRIAENRSDSIVMVKKCHYDQGLAALPGRNRDSCVRACVFPSPRRYKDEPSGRIHDPSDARDFQRRPHPADVSSLLQQITVKSA